MGILRVLLAIAVVVDHSAPFLGLRLTGGRVAVQLFYMMSGFYMALILDAKYAGRGGSLRFLASRALRLFPVYWAVVLLTLGTSLAARAMTGSWGRLDPWLVYGGQLHAVTKAILVAANVVLVGQDAVMFTGITPDGGLRFVKELDAGSPAVHQFLLVPQAWTLGVEMAFYLLAPWILRWRTSALLILLASSLCLRAWLAVVCGLSHDPWTYRFFPSELAVFLLGSLAFRIYASSDQRTRSALPGQAAMAVMASIIGAFPLLTSAAASWRELLPWTVYGLFFLLLPAIFRATRESRLDSAIGELSYPLYICHMLVIWVLRSVLVPLGLGAWLGEFAVLGSVALAALLTRVIVLPMERVRRVFST